MVGISPKLTSIVNLTHPTDSRPATGCFLSFQEIKIAIQRKIKRHLRNRRTILEDNKEKNLVEENELKGRDRQRLKTSLKR